jgi:RND family efflux transporter MFP subunit
MLMSKKVIALTAGLLSLLSVATLGQTPAPNGAAQASPGDTLSVSRCTVAWIEASNVAALREGVLYKMEAQVGHEVREGQELGYLHREMAKLKVDRARLSAENTASIKKAQAQKELALSVLAISKRLEDRNRTFISREEILKNEAEVKVADALVHEAEENQQIARSELALAQREFDEHTIKAPFAGRITERMRNEGESVRANEAVVRLVRIDRVRVVGWIPIDQMLRVKVGMPIEVRPNIPGANLAIEQMKFRGKISFIDAEVSPTKTEIRFHAEVENNEDHDLLPGLFVDALIYLNAGPAPDTAPSTVGARTTPPPR